MSDWPYTHWDEYPDETVWMDEMDRRITNLEMHRVGRTYMNIRTVLVIDLAILVVGIWLGSML